ncbi:phosphotransferase [Nocardia alni]|uniref:phosphotransferase n=1 Tax=Nocardia alni TaxID=2815723 RepID=UPI001C240281|nr:phosphotransferase [Nocardia alni]
MLDVTASLPRSPEELTAEWLTGALRTRCPGIVVEELDITGIVWGAATKVLLEASYSGVADTPPRRLCVKAGLDRRLDRVADDAIHTHEARFYGELCRLFDTSAPRSYYAAVDVSGRHGLIILEDLAAQGVRFVDAGEALTVDQVASGLGKQAAWHAATWGAKAGDLPGVAVGSITRQAAKMFFREDYWNDYFASDDAPRYPPRLQDPALLYRAFKSMWVADDAMTHCFQHGDAHAGNTFVRPGDDLGFVDWQTFCLGPWSDDVAYFVSGALSVADRRDREQDLLRHYLAELASAGGPRIDFDDAWPEYVRHLVHGLIWTMTPTVMQPVERTRAISERYVTAVEDHDAVFGRGEPLHRPGVR